ncbi:hypothetical protein ACQ4N7_28955 [Nodosilinea sp. AN01ver1]|uniref:hypothetical protein n=1 Tax=Nodosilinea sp. AN01ver1 TaxID=3423362 RepID=UPI003D312CED
MDNFPNISPDEISNIESRAIKDTEQPLITLRSFLYSFSEKYGKPIGEGRHRLVFSYSDSEVLKVPKNKNGIYDNLFEWNLYLKLGSKQIPCMPVLAKCHSLKYIHKIPCVVMERVSPIKLSHYLGSIPSWANVIDRKQLGQNKAGVLVAFDYADLNSAAFTFSI